jgi:hypothetical protein
LHLSYRRKRPHQPTPTPGRLVNPTDWDGESYCTTNGCELPATHQRWIGMIDDHAVIEMVCCRCSLDIYHRRAHN